ncbi:hypothetical protein [Sphingobium sp. Z007]|nr:hypothetical protein [Sphingobium sp. Z007]
MAYDSAAVPRVLEGVITGVGFSHSDDVAVVPTACIVLTFWVLVSLKRMGAMRTAKAPDAYQARRRARKKVAMAREASGPLGSV